MSVLLEEIRRIDSAAASVLEEAGIRTDSHIRSLTREDLRDLFPGHKEFNRRKDIFGIIHEQNPVDGFLKKLKGLFGGSSTGKSTSVTTSEGKPDNILPNDHQQGAHGSKPISSAIAGPVKPDNVQTHDRQQGAQVPTVKYWMVVSGTTFGAHLQLMDKIQGQLQGCRLQPADCIQDSQIIFVFCPVVSRLGTDVDAAMTDVKGDTPVILVLMHHMHAAKYVTSLRTWSDYSNVVLHVNIFYHEKMNGLLKCQENTAAVSQIQNKLLEIHPSKYPSADAQDEGSTTGSYTGGDN